MTWTDDGAARGPLRDSITHYFTVPYLGVIALVLVAGIVYSSHPWPAEVSKHTSIVGIAALAVVAIGPYAVTHVDSAAWNRNAFWRSLAGRTLDEPRQAMPAVGGISPFESEPANRPVAIPWDRLRGRNVILILLESTAARYLKPYGAAEDPCQF